MSSHAQTFTIDWFTIDGGGGASTGGVFAVSGTIGQPDANVQPMTGDGFLLAGGFWSLLANGGNTTAARDLIWINLAGGDWSVATNWSPSFVPTKNDNAIITNGVTVTLNGPGECLGLTLGNSPTFAGSGTLTLHGASTWSSGVMSGSGRTIIETKASLTVANPSGLGLLLNTRTLENAGTILWTGAGNIALNSGAVITNRPGALFHAQNAASIVASVGAGRVDNAGIFRKSGNTGTTTMAGPPTSSGSVSFHNSGSVEIQTGVLELGGGGTHSGRFIVPDGTALILSGGTHHASAGSRVTGAGQFTVSGAIATLAGLINISGNNTFSGGTADLTGNHICTNNTLTISGGTVNFDGTGAVAPAEIILSNGTLGGASVITVNNTMSWTSGTMSGSGRTIIPPGAALTIANPSGLGALLNTRTLENGGTILWTGAGNIALNFGAVITNRPGALFDARNAASIVASVGTGRFDNAGIFRKSGNTGITTFAFPSLGAAGVSFNNLGRLEILSGILAAESGFVSSPNALLHCTLGGTTPGTEYGQLQVAGAVTLNGALNVELIDGFVPASNDEFIVLTAGTRNGSFANFSFPSSVTMQLSNTPNSVVARVTGTSTALPRPALLPSQLSGADFKLSWTAVTNATYRVEFSPDLNPTNWIALPGDVLSVSNSASKFDLLSSSNRFYRVRVLP